MLHLYRSERADLLLEPLADVLAEPLPDPMAKEVVCVPTRGVERWLAQSLSHRLGAGPAGDDGVSANIDFPFPGALVYMATAAACGMPVSETWRDEAAKDPWSPGRLVWPLIEVVDEGLDEEYLRPLAGHLRAACGAGEGEAPRRFAVARHLADLFDSYSVHRPDMVLAWLEDSTGAGTGAKATVPVTGGRWAREEDFAWQAELWRRVRQKVGAPSLAERLVRATEILARKPEVLPLPERICVFGLTRLPQSYLRVLKAIAACRDVHLFLLHPSGALWDRTEAALASGAALAAPLPPREDDVTAQLARNPLLRNWGRDAREMQLVLASEAAVGGQYSPVDEDGEAAGLPEPSLLKLVQADVRADREPPAVAPGDGEDPRPVLNRADKSLQVHACHGRARQVEVVREAVLHLLALDPTLEPRDVIVMCPDIDLFAPLITAAFGPVNKEVSPRGAGEANDGRGPLLPARLADRSLRQTNPLLGVAAHLLELAASRVSAPQVLDFASSEPVRRRFELKEEDLTRIEGWVSATGARWGLDADHRKAWKLEGLGELGTWRAGLDRLLLGVAMAGAPEPFSGVLALDDVSSADIDLVGRFAELVERLHRALCQLSGSQSVRSWVPALALGTESLACAAESWQHDEFRRVLDEVAAMAGPPGGPEPAGPLLDLAEAAYLLADRLRGRPTRANFRTGDITICTLVPMRSVPHRVVCLLGLDGSSFPRHTAIDGDDLLAASPRVGDRDAPSEDRQLLLDALLAAKDYLVITYEGRDQRQNLPVAPAVPVAELLDVIDRTARNPDPTKRARDMVLVEHPLQSFDPRNYEAGKLGVQGPWRFDKVNFDGAVALAGERHARRPFLESQLSWQPKPVLQLRSLTQFLGSPVKEFLRERLGFHASFNDAVPSDRLPLELDGLGSWALGDRLLTSVLQGKSLDETVAAERARGLLPPGELGEHALGQALQVVRAILDKAMGFFDLAVPGSSYEVNVVLPGGRTLVGTVPQVRGATIALCTYSKLRARDRLLAWAHLLALSATHPELAPRAVTIARTGQDKTLACAAIIGPLGDSEAEIRRHALEHLSVLADLYDRGMREPLPLYSETSAAWATARRLDQDARQWAARAWGPGYDGRSGEALKAEHLTVLGGDARFDDLLQELPAPSEQGPSWPTEEQSRFGRLAVRLWMPLLDHERLEP